MQYPGYDCLGCYLRWVWYLARLAMVAYMVMLLVEIRALTTLRDMGWRLHRGI